MLFSKHVTASNDNNSTCNITLLYCTALQCLGPMDIPQLPNCQQNANSMKLVYTVKLRSQADFQYFYYARKDKDAL